MGFIGEHNCKIDAKGRFVFPAALKRQLDPSCQDNFVLNRGFEGCLVLYPQNEWEKITADLENLNLFVTKNRKFYRQFHNGAQQITIDGVGRILIPKGLMGSASITKEIVVFAYANRFEIWDKAKYDQAMSEDMEGFADLAEEVMGNTGSNE